MSGRVVEQRPGPRRADRPAQRLRRQDRGRQPRPRVIAEPGVLRTAWGATVSGIGAAEPGTPRSRCSVPPRSPCTSTRPTRSPRNVFAVTIAELDIHGTTVRVRGAEQPDGGTGLAADITAAAAADLDLEPGRTCTSSSRPKRCNCIRHWARRAAKSSPPASLVAVVRSGRPSPSPRRDHCAMGRPPGHSDTGGDVGVPPLVRVMEHWCGHSGEPVGLEDAIAVS